MSSDATICRASSLISAPSAAMFHHLDGRHGIAGWQWLLIVCGIISTLSVTSRKASQTSFDDATDLLLYGSAVPITVAGAFLLPDTPATTRTRLLSAEERAYAAERVATPANTKLDRTLFRRLFARWEIWTFSLLW